MFDNIGGKIKTLAKVICWIGIIGSVILAIIMFASAEDSYNEETNIMLGFVFLIGGTLLSWIGSFFAYGFGELIEKATEIEKNTRENRVCTEAPKNNFQSHSITHKENATAHKWRCENCGKMTSKSPCENCGYEPTTREETLARLLQAGLITEEEYILKTKK